MKKLLLVIAVIHFMLSASAQGDQIKQIFIEPKIMVVARPGIDIALPEFSKTHAFGLSAALSGLAKINNNIRLGVMVDENYFFGKKIPGTDQRYHNENILRITPEMVIRTNSNLIVRVDAGVAIITGNGFSETGLTGGLGVGIPIFGKIPLVGNLFRTKRHSVAEAELMLILTPRVLSQEED